MIGITRKIQRRTNAAIHSAGRRRSVILEISPGGDGTPGPGFVGFRLERQRTIYWLPADWCWREAVKGFLASRRAERKRLREEKRKKYA